MPRALALLVSAGLAVTPVACGGATFQPRGPVGPGGEPFPGPSVLGDPDTGAMPARLEGFRQVCRTGPIPRGWVAIRYLQLPSKCPQRKGDNGYNGVLLEYHDDKPVGAVMVVCADQVVPRDWVWEGNRDDEVCEGARVDPGDPTVQLIRRVR